MQFRGLDKHSNIQLEVGDILDFEQLNHSLSKFCPTHVVHCAAIAGINTVIENPTKTLRVNILGTANLLDTIRRLNLNLDRVVGRKLRCRERTCHRQARSQHRKS